MNILQIHNFSQSFASIGRVDLVYWNGAGGRGAKMGHPFTGTIYFALRVASVGGREAGHSSATFFIIKVFAGAGCRLICWAGLGWAGLV